MSIPAAAATAVDHARNDAAQRLGIDAGHIAILEAVPVDWPDAALGCPKAGRMYVQVITPGFRIRLGGAGQLLEYHSDLAGRVVLCSGTAGEGY